MLENELQTARVFLRVGLFLGPANEHERRNRNGEILKMELALHQMRRLERLIGDQAHATSAQVFQAPSDGKSSPGTEGRKFFALEQAGCRVSRMVSPFARPLTLHRALKLLCASAQTLLSERISPRL